MQLSDKESLNKNNVLLLVTESVQSQIKLHILAPQHLNTSWRICSIQGINLYDKRTACEHAFHV
jgi:hypothetical protein